VNHKVWSTPFIVTEKAPLSPGSYEDLSKYDVELKQFMGVTKAANNRRKQIIRSLDVDIGKSQP